MDMRWNVLALFLDPHVSEQVATWTECWMQCTHIIEHDVRTELPIWKPWNLVTCHNCCNCYLRYHNTYAHNSDFWIDRSLNVPQVTRFKDIKKAYFAPVEILWSFGSWLLPFSSSTSWLAGVLSASFNKDASTVMLKITDRVHRIIAPRTRDAQAAWGW